MVWILDITVNSLVKTQNLGDQLSENLELGWYCLYSQTYKVVSSGMLYVLYIPQTLFYVKIFLIERVWRNPIAMLLERKKTQTNKLLPCLCITALTTTKNPKHNLFRWRGFEQTLKSLIYGAKNKKGCDKQHLQYWVADQLLLIFLTHNI